MRLYFMHNGRQRNMLPINKYSPQIFRNRIIKKQEKEANKKMCSHGLFVLYSGSKGLEICRLSVPIYTHILPQIKRALS